MHLRAFITVSKILSILLFFFSVSSAFAANRYWVATGAANWNNTANWSTTSGTGSGASVPGVGDVAIFDGAGGSIGNCTIDATVSIAGITIMGGYSGTISQGINPITIGTSGASLSGGTFIGGSATITANGAFTISGTAFTSTSANLIIGDGVTISLSSGSFTHNNGTLHFTTSNNSTSGNFSLYNLTLDNTTSFTNTFAMASASNVLTVTNTLSIAGNSPIMINTGTIAAQGNVTMTSTSTGGGGNATLLINGTGTQTLTGQGTLGAGKLPMVHINKSSGVLNLMSVISAANNWTYGAGTISPGTSKVVFMNTLTVTGSHALNEIEFHANANHTISIAAGTNLTANGDLAISGSSVMTINTGTIEAKANVTTTNTNTGGGGSATILINGNGTQTLTGSGISNQGKLPIIHINKAAGTLNLVGTISLVNNWTYTAGTISAGTSRLVFAGDLTITGTQTYNEIEFNGTSSSHIINIAAGTTLTVNNNIYISGANNVAINTGTVVAKADVVITNAGTGGGGSATLLIDGTTNQTLTGPGVSNAGKLPIVTVNKPSGTLNLVGILSTANNWTHIAGTISPGTSRVVFAGDLTITGTQTFNEVEFNGTSSSYTITIAAGTTLTANGNIYIAGVNNIAINTGTLEAKADVMITNAGTGGGGSATLLIDGTGNQTLTGPGVSNAGKLPIVTVNKPSGTLNLVSILSTANNWTHIAGTISAGTSRVVFAGDLTITGTQTFNEVEFNGTSSSYVMTIAAGTTLTINGNTVISGGNNISINTGTLEVKGDITITNTGTGGGGNATLLINGTGTQTLTGPGVSNQGKLPIVTINKPSGTLNLVNILSTANNWTRTAGTISAGTSRVVFAGTLTITGTQTLNDVEFNGTSSSYTITIAAGTTLTANGNTYISGVNNVTINTGTLESKGDLTVTNTNNAGGGTAMILINGTGTQNFSSTTTGGNGKLPSITIAKTAGTLNMSGTLTVVGGWTYVEGTVNAGTSTVYFLTTGNVDAQGTSTSMAFYNVTLGDANTRTLQGNLTLSNVLALGTGKINLNGFTTIMNLNSTAAITRSSGSIVSESTNNSSKISWNIGTVTGTYVYPFTTSGGTYIPFTFQLTAGNAGYVTVSTYPTGSNNLPLPSTPDVVTNVNSNAGTDNSSSVIDRFWQIDKSGVSGTATLTYTYAAAEVTGSVVGQKALLQAQRYNVSNNMWDAALPGQTSNAAANTVTEPGVTLFSPRTLVLYTSPLPIELLWFTAIPTNNKVILNWATATEINNNSFTIEKTVDGSTFEIVTNLKGAGNSASTLYYSAADNNPHDGVSYYRLTQTDYDGTQTYSKLIAVEFHAGVSEGFIVYPNPGNGDDINLLITGSEGEENIIVAVYSASGKQQNAELIRSRDFKNTYTINTFTKLPAGIYLIGLTINQTVYWNKLLVQ